MSSSNSSAILGYPPNNEDDFFIVRGIFRSVGLFSANASRGWITVPKEPAGYVYETKQPGIIAGMVIVILLISVVTATRLALRYYSTKMVFGSDDWVILAAAVSLPPTCWPLCGLRTIHTIRIYTSSLCKYYSQARNGER